MRIGVQIQLSKINADLDPQSCLQIWPDTFTAVSDNFLSEEVQIGIDQLSARLFVRGTCDYIEPVIYNMIIKKTFLVIQRTILD